MQRLVFWMIGFAATVAASAAAPQPVQLNWLPTAEQPRLPEAAPPIGPLRRGADGKIEVIDPESEQRSGTPLCSAGALCVGPGQRYRTLAAGLEAARDGAVIELIGGTYRESANIVRRNLTLRGVAGRPHIDCSDLALAGERACLLLSAEGITLDNLELSGAEPAAGSDGTAACVANETGIDFTVSQILCHGSQNGLIAHGGAIVISESEFYDNGRTPGSNNVALDGACLATVRGSIFRDARNGAELLSRCSRTTISDSTFRSVASRVALDLPDGGETMVYRSALEKVRDVARGDVVRFAADACRHPGALVLKQVKIVNSRSDTGIRNFDRCLGDAIILDHVGFVGIPPQQYGYILVR